MVRLVGDTGLTCQHGDSDAERKQKRTGSFETRVELVQEAIKSGQDYIQQSRDLVSERTLRAWEMPAEAEDSA